MCDPGMAPWLLELLDGPGFSMVPASSPFLIERFAALEDPRQSCPLPEVLPLALCGTLAGAGGFVEVRRWGRVHLDAPRRLLPCASGLPATTPWAPWASLSGSGRRLSDMILQRCL